MKQPVVLFASLCFLASEAMQAQNAQNSPKAYVVSDAHLDTQWNWDIQTTIQEYVWNTLNQNLFLLRKYPDYVFNFEGAVKYSWMKEYFPTRYEELKQRVKEGRWHVTGSSWDANDVLVPSAESVLRNILYGQNYYRTEFGTESTDIFARLLWLWVDTAVAGSSLWADRLFFTKARLAQSSFYGDKNIRLPSDCGRVLMAIDHVCAWL